MCGGGIDTTGENRSGQAKQRTTEQSLSVDAYTMQVDMTYVLSSKKRYGTLPPWGLKSAVGMLFMWGANPHPLN